MRDVSGNDRVFSERIGPVVDAGAACGLAEDGDAGAIAPEACDVVPNPCDRATLVAKSGILFYPWSSAEAKYA